MGKAWIASGAAWLAAWSVAGAQAPAAPAPPPAAPDYASAAAWACRPGTAGACAGDLGAMRVEVTGPRAPDPFTPAADPPIDCFYVYPTTSQQPQDYARAEHEPSVDHTVRVQAARLASRCRVFAPLYRQLTSAGLERQLKNSDRGALNFDPAYEDVRAAWRRYLAQDNHGRGVVIVGHSQGSILLSRLLAEEIERGAERRLLVSAILAGHPGVLVPAGKDVGGTFKVTPLCRSGAQTGCVVVWSTYPAGEAPDAATRLFARDRAGMDAACVNPAAPGGGEAPLHPVFSRPSIAPETDPPFVEPVGQVLGGCASDGAGHVLQVKVADGPYAPLVQTLFDRYDRHNGWGLHALDVQMVEDDVAALIGTQTAAYLAARR